MGYRDPVRPINTAFLAGLELTSTNVKPLPGGTGRRINNQVDPRLTGIAGSTAVGDEVCYYEHIATIYHRQTGKYFIAFRETMDAFLARSTDLSKYPEWLMKSPEKQAERHVHIYMMTRLPSQVSVMRSHEDWLCDIQDTAIFDALAYFLAQNNVIDEKVLATLR